MPKKTIWYCPCDCKTPKGMKKKFYLISSLFSHIIDNHSKALDIKLMYKLKGSEISVGKKRTAEEYEDGYKEIQSVEEEEEDQKLEAEIEDLIIPAKNFKL